MRIGSICAALAVGLCASAHAETHYVAMPLQFASAFIGGCTVTALSSNGLSAGVCGDGTNQVPSMWDDQGHQTLLAMPSDAQYAWATGINSLGQVSGHYLTSAGSLLALRWDNGQFTVLDQGGGYSAANAINDSGDVVGTTGMAAVIWKHNGNVVSLPAPVLPGLESTGSSGFAINVHGMVAGSSWYNGNAVLSQPVLWQRRQPTSLAPAALGDFKGASALNEQGTIVGSTASGGVTTAWLWTTSSATQLPGLPDSNFTAAYGINRAGVVVGITMDSNFSGHGVKWLNGQLTKLDEVTVTPPASGAYLFSAPAINDLGWIAVQYQLSAPPYSYPAILKPIRRAGATDAE